jgi:hypothetical protein
MGATEKRATNRLPVVLDATAISLVGTERAKLLDLSAEGARLSHSGVISPGKDVVLMWDGHEAFGRVVWVNDDQYGVVFDEPIAPTVLKATQVAGELSRNSDPEEQDRLAAKAWVSGELRLGAGD